MPDLDSFPYGGVQDYCADQSSKENEILQHLRRESRLTLIHPRMLSGPFQGRILAMLSRMLKPKRILELGTYSGYSAICLAEGLVEGGELITIEKDDELGRIQSTFLDRPEFKDRIKRLHGDAMEVIQELEGTFDLIFLDADKERYPDYYPRLKPLLAKGGILLVDNVLWDGKVMEDVNDERTQAIQELVRMVKEDRAMEQVLLPIRDGLLMAQKV